MSKNTILLLVVGAVGLWWLSHRSTPLTVSGSATVATGTGYPLQNYRNGTAEVISSVGQALGGIINAFQTS